MILREKMVCKNEKHNRTLGIFEVCAEYIHILVSIYCSEIRHKRHNKLK
jgi:hypothetical protein